MKKTVLVIIAALLFLFVTIEHAASETKNGFEVSGGLIESEQILHGGPGKDGIPALSKPQFTSAEHNTFLRENDRVLGVAIGAMAKAYPIRILNWHEVVNDRIGDTPFVVSYCPLCGTGVVFSALIKGTATEFGVSGLLYNSDVLLYDRTTESLWSQILGTAVTGKYRGEKLSLIPVTHTTWKSWQKTYPNSLVLSEQTGYQRDYDRNPYGGYEKSNRLYFPVAAASTAEIHPKETVLGITVAGKHKAYPFSILKKLAQSTISDSFNGLNFILHWDEEGHSATIVDTLGRQLPSLQGFWFAWYAFYPDTEVFSGAELPSPQN